LTILEANAAAAMNKAKFSAHDKHLLDQYARQTAPGYCAGCADICESAVDYSVPISDILRYSMYNCSYGDRETASALFHALPLDIKTNLLKTDFSEAENRCPQKMRIGKVLKTALEDLTWYGNTPVVPNLPLDV